MKQELVRRGFKSGNAAGGAQPPQDTPLTREEVQTLIRDGVKAGLAEVKVQPPTIDIKSITEGIVAAVKPEIDAVKTEVAGLKSAPAGGARQVLNPGDAGGQRSQIEVPISWCKGNLPLHGKQLLNILQRKHVNDGIDVEDIRKGVQHGDAMFHRYKSYVDGSKALTSTGAGSGDEFVPSDLSGELQRRLFLASALYQIMAGSEIDMPSQPYTFPLSTTRPTFYGGFSENSAKTESTPGTGNFSLDAKLFAAKVLYSYEVDEDSLIAMLPMLQQQLADAGAAAIEDTILNGDTTATHQDSDIHAVANHAAKNFKGLRKLALAASLKTDFTAGLTAANLLALKKQMKKYAAGAATRDLLYVIGVMSESTMLGVSEVLTADKAGPNATILTGKLPSIFGIPLVTSAAQREDTNATGVYDGTTMTKGIVTLFNRSQFKLGRRRDFTVEVDKDIDNQQYKLVASFRKAFSPIETPSSTITSVAVGYNYTA